MGILGQIELQVFKRTSTDATLMDSWCERGGERLGVKKSQRQGQSDWISEHIAHYGPRQGCEISSQLGLADEVLTACGLVGGVCACVHMFACTCTHCCPHTGVHLKQEKERWGVGSEHHSALSFNIWNDALLSSATVTWQVTSEATGEEDKIEGKSSSELFMSIHFFLFEL